MKPCTVEERMDILAKGWFLALGVVFLVAFMLSLVFATPALLIALFGMLSFGAFYFVVFGSPTSRKRFAGLFWWI